jgi:hypothetical protein
MYAFNRKSMVSLLGGYAGFRLVARNTACRKLSRVAIAGLGCRAADIAIQHFPRFSDFRDSAFSAVQNAALLEAGDALGAVAEVAIQDLAIMLAERGRGKRQEAGKGREAQWKAWRVELAENSVADFAYRLARAQAGMIDGLVDRQHRRDWNPYLAQCLQRGGVAGAGCEPGFDRLNNLVAMLQA